MVKWIQQSGHVYFAGQTSLGLNHSSHCATKSFKFGEPQRLICNMVMILISVIVSNALTRLYLISYLELLAILSI